MLDNETYSNIMKKIQYYAKNVTGTNSYWYQVKQHLKTMLQQVGSPTICFTLSCAEFHWPEFHALFGEVDTSSNEVYRKNVLDYPHILDWFFTERVESFVKHWLYNTLGATWHWYRFEFAVLRGAIHCHGFVKLSSDFGVCDRTQKAVKGFECQQNVKQGLSVPHSFEQIIEEGKKAEQEVCDYYDYLVSCTNPVQYKEWVKPDVHLCRISYSDALNQLDNDYANLVNTVELHTKCNSQYCLKTNSENEQYCRFNYPFDLQTKTHIEYKKKKTRTRHIIRPEVIARRNDPRLNRHQKIQLQGWRANCDIQLVIDHHACIEYLAKYATKSEKMSSIARNAFVAVVSNLQETSSVESVVRKLMIKSVGERDMGRQEVMHQILSLKLYKSSFQTIIISLENSRLCKISDGDIIVEKSNLEIYAGRCTYSKSNTDIKNINLITFFANYCIRNSKIIKRSKPVIV